MSGILRLDLNTNNVEAILEPNAENSLYPHGVVAVEHGIVFSDIGSQSLKFFGDTGISAHNISVTTLAGNGYHGNEDGLGCDSNFAQPTGICHEGNTIIAVDSVAKTIYNYDLLRRWTSRIVNL